MFFFLSKTVSYLVMPYTIIVLLLVLHLLIRDKRWKRRFLASSVVLLLFFSNDFIANETMLAWELPAVALGKVGEHKLAIVLTGTTMSGMEPDDRVYFSKGADRVTHTVQLYKLGLVRKILVSGGSGRLLGDETPEANKFRDAMTMMGVRPEDIIIENETRNTYESAVAVRPMLDSMGIKPSDCLLVTSAFHMRRSLACYRKAGVDLDYFSTDFYSHPRDYYPDAFILPRPEALMIWQKLFREWIGFAAYWVAGYV